MSRDRATESVHDDPRVRAALQAVGATASTRDAITTRRLRLPNALTEGIDADDPATRGLPGSWWYAAHSWPSDESRHAPRARVALLRGDRAPPAADMPDWPLSRPATLILDIGAAGDRAARGALAPPVRTPAHVDLSNASAREYLAWLASLDVAIVVGSDAWRDAVAVGTPVLHLDRDAVVPFVPTPARAARSIDDPCALIAEQRTALRTVLLREADLPDSVAGLNRALAAAGRTPIDDLDPNARVLPPRRRETDAPTRAQRRRSAGARRRRKLAKLRQSPRRFLADALKARCR